MANQDPPATGAEAWHRTAGTTVLRALIAGGVLVVAGVAGILADIYLFKQGSDGWEDLQAIVGVMVVGAGGLGYALLVYWWVDHLLAPKGPRVALAVHTAVAAVVVGVVALIGGGGGEALGAAALGVAIAAVAVAIATLLAGRVHGSFRPKNASA